MHGIYPQLRGSLRKSHIPSATDDSLMYKAAEAVFFRSDKYNQLQPPAYYPRQ